MGYLEIFNEVVSIMHNDYSGCMDNKGGDNPEEYAEIIKEMEEKNELDDGKFTSLVKEYIAYFKDYHVNFTNLNSNSAPLTVGFWLRKYKDKLYVVNTTYEKNLEIGDAIIEIDGMSVETLHKKYKKRLHEQPDERQWDWHVLLINHKEAVIEKKNGEKIKFNINKYENKTSFSKYTLEFLKNEIALFTLDDFQNEEAIRKLIEENKERLEHCEKWIIDVRNNGGGSDISYYPLMGYILENEKDLECNDGKNEYLMTNRNCNGRIKSFDEYLEEEGETMPSEIKEVINKLKAFYEENTGNGFMELKGDFDDGFKFEPKTNPKKIVMLTDVNCGSSGDQFVLQSSRSAKVTTIGRNTLGILDYSNCTFEMIGDRFRLMYATSRNTRVDEGRGMKGIGIAPDIYIPWTPEMCERDIDMEKALEILEYK